MMDIQKSTVPCDAEILVAYRCPGSDTVFLQYGRDPLPPWAVVVREVKRGCQFAMRLRGDSLIPPEVRTVTDDIVERLRSFAELGDIGSVAMEDAADEIVNLRAALNWLRGWRTKDHESIDCTIQHALGEAETCTVCHPHGNATQAGEKP